ncbi:MSH6 [Symbiodinium pilosum]|uniref:MSH6 protein n=1 Tax=Symbiodinium pilosum TaxID=2952 RepID=A0A812R3T4_SYMPI|nr:MSH6 [Symbiodinium pilosum]
MISKALAAGFGAVAVQIFSGLAPSRAAWTWTLSIPTDGGFSCQEGNTITGNSSSTAADFDCTVVPDDGKTCDVTKISMLCSDSEGGKQNFVPTDGLCINNVAYAETNNMTPDTLSWSQVPVCTNATSTSGAGAGKMMACATATVLAGVIF